MLAYKAAISFFILKAVILSCFGRMIIRSPQDATVNLGEKATFTVQHECCSTYGYHYNWFVNGRSVSPLEQLTVLATEDMQNAEIYVEVRSLAYTERSASAFLHIRPPPLGNLPALNNDFPSSVTSFEGDYVDLAVNNETATGSDIQWFMNNIPLAYQIYPQIHLQIGREMDGAELSVVVTNKAGSVRQAAILHVYWAKWIVASVGGVIILLLIAAIVGGVVLMKRRKSQANNPYQLVNEQIVQKDTDLLP